MPIVTLIPTVTLLSPEIVVKLVDVLKVSRELEVVLDDWLVIVLDVGVVSNVVVVVVDFVDVVEFGDGEESSIADSSAGVLADAGFVRRSVVDVVFKSRASVKIDVFVVVVVDECVVVVVLFELDAALV